jgi:hypothetical protein
MHAPERILLAASAALVLGAALAAQDAPVAEAPPGGLAEADLYHREVFRYQVGGRPDPFQPLLSGDEIGVRAQDLTLEGIVYSSSPGGSMAIFTLPGDAGRVRLRTGQRTGSVTVVAIHPRRVDVREDQFGVSRAYSLELQRRGPAAVEGRAQPPAPPPGQAPAAAPPPAPAPGGRP